ncbi:MAG: SDR family NAD(P)-dependent oxidoreductase [Thermoanaerobaculia bacterium]
MDPRNRHVLLTGASSGIGRATALALAGRGARLSIAARRANELEQVAARCRDLGAECVAIPADISSREECRRLAAEAEERFGPVEILINNAGFAIFDPISEARPGDLESMMATNYFGTLWCTQAVLGGMIRRGEGAIVNVGSIAGIMGFARMGGYSATKFAVAGLTEALRSETMRHGIRVSLVSPGTTATDFFVTAEKGKMPGASRLMLAIPPEKVARKILAAIERGDRRRIVPLGARLFMRFKEIAPGPAHFLMSHVSSWIDRSQR